MQRARSFSLLVALVFALGAVPATAATHTVAPPGNSGVNQYVESIPTAGGGQPSSTVHPHAPVGGGGGGSGSLGPGGGGGGSGSSGPGGGAGGGTTGGSGGSGGSIPASTLRALRAHGRTGAAAAALAAATSPSRAKSAPARQAGTVNAASPFTTVVHALTGSSGGGTGLGALLPIILITSALAITATALRARRRAGA